MKILFDTNVVLDVLMERAPFAEPAVKLLSEVETRKITGYLCATTTTTIYYILNKALGKKQRTRQLKVYSNYLTLQKSIIKHCSMHFP